MASYFPHLHLHSEYSERDGIGSPDDYVARATDLGVPCLAITDHGHFAAAPRQEKACREGGVKAIYGIELYQNEDRGSDIRDRIREIRGTKSKAKLDKDTHERLNIAEAVLRERFAPSYHGLLLARNFDGFKNVSRISSDAWINGFYYRPRTDTESLGRWSNGVVYSTACMGGWVPRAVLENPDEARRRLLMLLDIYGMENLRVELPVSSFLEQVPVNGAMLRLAKQLGVKCILSADVHYPFPADSRAQDVLLLMRDKKTIADVGAGDGAWQFEAKDLYFKSIKEIVRTWRDYHQEEIPPDDFRKALKNTIDLAESIEPIELDRTLKLPGVFDEPDRRFHERCLAEFKRAALDGTIPRLQLPVYRDRLKTEMDVIEKKRFSEYFLILDDLCRYVRERKFARGPSRGSAGGSLVSYLLGITVGMDPIRFGLPFERFLDETRPDPPDIDLDFEPEARDPIKRYLEETYPAVASIGSWGTFKPRSLLIDVGRVFQLQSAEIFPITKEMGSDADKMSWDEIFEAWPKVKAWANEHAEAFSIVKRLRGLVSNRSVAASGVLVGPSGSLDVVPVTQRDGLIATAWADSQEHRELSELGFLKIDVLGVANVKVVPRALELVAEIGGEEVDPDDIPIDDPAALSQFHKDPTGAFQFDTITTAPIVELVGVDSFFDLPAITSLCRPGPLNKGIPRRFAKRKRDPQWREKVPSFLADILTETYGLMIYQEDVMKVAVEIGGMTMAEANAFRKVIGKKLDKEKFNKYRDQFIKSAFAKGVPKELIKEIWLQILEFAGYGFNRSHACAYSLTAYRQMWVRAHHPTCYYTALLESTKRDKKQAGQDQENQHRYLRSAMRAGIPVLPPDVNRSGIDFVTDGDSIFFGLSKVKGVKTGAEAIVEARGDRSFESIEDFVERVDSRKVNARVTTALTYAGAFDGLFSDAGSPGILIRNDVAARFGKVKKSKNPVPSHGVAALLRKEREVIGLALSIWSGGGVSDIRDQYGISTIDKALGDDLDRLDVLGEVTRFRPHKTARGKMAFVSIADETSTLDNITIWPEQLEKFGIKKDTLGIFRLKRRENTNKRFGRWSYYFRDNLERPFLPVTRMIFE